jgi:uncharacterized protein YndB with AHSA1/START domain
MCQWLFEPIAEFRPEPGFSTQFTVRVDDRDYVHLWRVTEVIPEKKIAYEWKYAGLPGESLVVWELFEAPGGTRLRLTHGGGETFPQDDPAFERATGQAGWEYLIRDRLTAFLEQGGSH